MQIEIARDISENLEKASKELRLNKKELIARAIKLYLNSIKEYVNLKEELEAWERAGTEDLLAFENKI